MEKVILLARTTIIFLVAIFKEKTKQIFCLHEDLFRLSVDEIVLRT